MGQGSNKNNTAGGEDAMGLTVVFEPFVQDVL
jgi:hypothetical protein